MILDQYAPAAELALFALQVLLPTPSATARRHVSSRGGGGAGRGLLLLQENPRRVPQNPHPSKISIRVGLRGCLPNVGQPQLLVPTVKSLETSQ